MISTNPEWQCCILGIQWSGFVRNLTVSKNTGLSYIWEVIGDRRLASLAFFRHVRWLPASTPVNNALQVTVKLLPAPLEEKARKTMKYLTS